MKILFISSYVDPATGASILMRLAERLKQDGHEVRIITTARGFDSDITKSIVLPGILDISSSLINRLLPNYFSLVYFRLLNEVASYDPDVINIHWTHGRRAIPIQAIPQICKKYPVFWTMHDLWPLTANSFFEFSGGNALVAPDDSLLQRITRKITFSPKWLFRYKVALLGKTSMHTISPSKWLLNKVNSSPVFSSSSNHCVPNGVDITVFKPQSRKKLREKYSIPQDDKVILFLSANIADKRKGFYYFAKAIERLKEVNPELISKTTVLLVGENSATGNKYLSSKVVNLESTRMQSQLAEYYGLADVFVSASLADNFPSTSLESLACGTPVVAFDVGGVSEIVIKHKTGLLAPSKNINNFSTDIEELLVNTDLHRKLSASCREYAVKYFDLDECVNNYMRLFGSAIVRN